MGYLSDVLNFDSNMLNISLVIKNDGFISECATHEKNNK